jgi:hypothetical protein
LTSILDYAILAQVCRVVIQCRQKEERAVDRTLAASLLATLVSTCVTGRVAQATYQVVQRVFEGMPEQMPPRDEPEQLAALVVDQANSVSALRLHDAAIEVVAVASATAQIIRDERSRQAKMTFQGAVVLASIGVTLSIAGILVLISGNAIPGTITVAMGTISEAMAVVLLWLTGRMNDRLDEISGDLNAIRNAKVAIDLIEKLTNSDQIDESLRELAADLRRQYVGRCLSRPQAQSAAVAAAQPPDA